MRGTRPPFWHLHQYGVSAPAVPGRVPGVAMLLLGRADWVVSGTMCRMLLVCIWKDPGISICRLAW